jgi:hypothetical protein
LKESFSTRVVLSGLAILFIFWLASRKSFYGDTISSAFLAVALLSVFLILLRTGTNLWEICGVAVIFLGLALIDLRILGFRTAWPVWVSFLGIASVAVLALRVLWSQGPARRIAVYTFVPALLFVTSEWCASYFLDWTQKARPRVLDLYLYSFDASLHVQLPFLFGQAFARSQSLSLISLLFYLGLPIAIGLTYAGCLMNDRKNAFPALLAFLLTGPIGAIFYTMFPALGPVHIFMADFPWRPLTYQQVPRLFLESLPVAGPRNAIPSLHAAWIFLVLWFCRGLSLVEKIVGAVFVIFTLIATLGTGEHYLVDLIAALPFTLFMLAVGYLLAGPRPYSLAIPCLTGLGMTLGWFALLRFTPHLFWRSPIVPWMTIAFTVVGCALAGNLLPTGRFIGRQPTTAFQAPLAALHSQNET